MKLKNVMALSLFVYALHVQNSMATAIEGMYSAPSPYKSEMKITKEGENHKIELKGGSNSEDGNAASSDCEAVAIGKLNNDVLQGKLIPFEGDNVSLSKADIAKLKEPIVLKFGSKGVEVSGPFSYCGLRNNLGGLYIKTQSVSTVSTPLKDELKTVDAKLNSTYQIILKSLNSDQKKFLQDSQRLWIKFRDAECEFSQSIKKAGNREECLSRLTLQRIEQLNKYKN